MIKKLNIMATLKDGVAIALVNYLSLVATAALYVLTIWIPYLNVGTTIAMSSLPAEMAKGNIVNPLFIFKGEYRKNMGEFFILYSLMVGAIGAGFLFMVIPGIVLSIAWTFAVVLFVDKGMNALEALRESNNITYGNKFRIFCTQFVLCVCLCVAIAIINAIFGIGNVGWLETIGTLINLVIIIFAIPAIYGVNASIYKQLTTGNIIGEDAPVIEAPTTPVAPATPAAPKAAEAPKAPKAETPKTPKAE